MANEEPDFDLVHDLDSKRRQTTLFTAFILSWLVVFPVACGMGICSFAFGTTGGLGGAPKDDRVIVRETRVYLVDPGLLFASGVLAVIVGLVSIRYYGTIWLAAVKKYSCLKNRLREDKMGLLRMHRQLQ